MTDADQATADLRREMRRRVEVATAEQLEDMRIAFDVAGSFLARIVMRHTGQVVYLGTDAAAAMVSDGLAYYEHEAP